MLLWVTSKILTCCPTMIGTLFCLLHDLVQSCFQESAQSDPQSYPPELKLSVQAVQMNIHCPVPSGLNPPDQLMSLSKATTISSSDWLFSLKRRRYSGPSMSTVLHTKPVSASNGAPPATTLFPDPGSSQLDCGLWPVVFPLLGICCGILWLCQHDTGLVPCVCGLLFCGLLSTANCRLDRLD